MHSSRVRLILVTLSSVLALSALTAAAAQAVEAPRWSVGGTDLAEGKTHFITGKAYSTNLKLRTGNVAMSCTAVKPKEGSLLGSAPGNAGKVNAVLVFETCTVSGTAGGKTIEKCKLNQPLETTPLLSELVESEGAKPAEKKGSLLVLFTPFSGTSFAIVKFTTEAGGNCPPETHVTGKVTAQVFTDPNTPPTLGTLVTLESGAVEAHSALLNFPATQPKNVVRIIGGVAKEEENKGLTAFSEQATAEGTALILLANAKKETEETNWSALP